MKNTTYSFKYFGKYSGVRVYTFIDDRKVLFHHTVISASEREAAYVIDGLNNKTKILNWALYAHQKLALTAPPFSVAAERRTQQDFSKTRS